MVHVPLVRQEQARALPEPDRPRQDFRREVRPPVCGLERVDEDGPPEPEQPLHPRGVAEQEHGRDEGAEKVHVRDVRIPRNADDGSRVVMVVLEAFRQVSQHRDPVRQVVEDEVNHTASQVHVHPGQEHDDEAQAPTYPRLGTRHRCYVCQEAACPRPVHQQDHKDRNANDLHHQHWRWLERPVVPPEVELPEVLRVASRVVAAAVGRGEADASDVLALVVPARVGESPAAVLPAARELERAAAALAAPEAARIAELLAVREVVQVRIQGAELSPNATQVRPRMPDGLLDVDAKHVKVTGEPAVHEEKVVGPPHVVVVGHRVVPTRKQLSVDRSKPPLALNCHSQTHCHYGGARRGHGARVHRHGAHQCPPYSRTAPLSKDGGACPQHKRDFLAGPSPA
mmetsp:Transcript_2030/g.5401  ORF Transcript_2030/g.5401 Transcript_2030/m.5401 type:complete len:399 (-) Transcript_2030:8-1204(-)